MAAHIVTGLKEVKNWIEQGKVDKTHIGFLNAALELSTWTEDLEMDEWGDLRLITDLLMDSDTNNQKWGLELLEKTIDKYLNKYQEELEKLGNPTTREQWIDRKYEKIVTGGN